MNGLLVVTADDGLYTELQKQLAEEYDIRRSYDISDAQPLVDDGWASVLLIDCPAEDEPVCEFLRQNELTHPYLECTVLLDPEHFCRLALSKSHNLFLLLRPIETADVARVLLNTKVKLARDAAFSLTADPAFIRQQERHFWLTLIHSSVRPSAPPLSSAPPVNFSFPVDRPILPLLVCFRGWRTPPTSRREQEVLRFGLHSYLEQALPQQYGGVSLELDADSTLLILYGDPLPSSDELEQRCRDIIHIAERGLNCNVSCYCGEPCHIHSIGEQAQLLTAGDWNNVTENQGVFSLTQLQQEHDPLSVPMPQNWMIYFNQGRLDDFCRCIDEFFQQAIAANTLNRDFLTSFQQDMVQELGFALKSAGVPAHRLLRGLSGAEKMRAATRSVFDMEAWVRTVAEEAMALTGATSETIDVVDAVIQHIHLNISRPISRADLSDLLHLSQGHIARVFRQRMGMSISDYITKQRMDMACLMLTQSNLPPGVVAQRCGFPDYPYFYKTFKKETGLAPSDYQKQMHV